MKDFIKSKEVSKENKDDEIVLMSVGFSSSFIALATSHNDMQSIITRIHTARVQHLLLTLLSYHYVNTTVQAQHFYGG
jgi:hypothetical protein